MMVAEQDLEASALSISKMPFSSLPDCGDPLLIEVESLRPALIVN